MKSTLYLKFLCLLRERARKVPNVSTIGDTELDVPSCGLFGGGGVAGINFALLNLRGENSNVKYINKTTRKHF